MPFSHHSHSGQFCKHASGKLEEVVLEAIRQGFHVFGLTEHVPRYSESDLYPEEEGMSLEALSSQFDGFLVEAHRLKELYADKITLLVGLETEYISEGDLDHLEQQLKKYSNRVQYIVGSVHHVNGIPIDFDLATYQKSLTSFAVEGQSDSGRMDAFFASYFDAQFELLRRFHPEIIGHIDLCRLYEPSLSLKEYPAAWEKLKRNVQYAADYGALFEVNAAAFRKGWSSAYPAEDVLAIIQEAGGRFALSDDSHGPHAVGLNYHRAAEYLRRVDVHELWYLESVDEPNVAGRYVKPRKVEGNWWDDSFWTKVAADRYKR